MLAVAAATLACLLALPAFALAAPGELTFLEFDKDGVGLIDGLDAARAVTVSPDGKNTYVTSDNDNAVVTFARTATTGALTFAELDRDNENGVDGLGSANSVVVSPDGRNAYVTGYTKSAVATFTRDPTTGALTFLEVHKNGVDGVDGIAGASFVTVSPDGKNAYATGAGGDAVATFTRNTATGALTFLEAHKDGVDGVDGLDFAISVAVSPDGKNAYVAGYDDNAAATFTRDTTTGALTFLDVDKDGDDGDDGLARAFSVTVSPDGKNAYVAGSGDNAAATFTRDTTTGALTFLEVDKDGVDGVDGLASASSVTVSPDGKNAYVAGSGDDAVATFTRDTTTGALTFLDVEKDGVDGLDGAISVAVSPDGRNVYAAAYNEDAVATFAREPVSQTLTVSTSGPGSGTVTAAGISCGPNNAGDCAQTADWGTAFTLIATPAANSTFGAFTGAGCANSPCAVTLDADKSVDARFALAPAPALPDRARPPMPRRPAVPSWPRRPASGRCASR